MRYGFAAKCAITASTTLTPTTLANSSRVARRTPGQAAKRRQQRLSASQADAGHEVEAPHGRSRFFPRLAVEGDLKVTRLVSNALQQTQRAAVGIERKWFH